VDGIGGFAFIYLKGEIGAQKPVNQDISRPGVTGSAWRILPSKGESTTLAGMAIFSSNTAAAEAAASYATYSSTTQTIVIGGLGSFSGYFIEDVHVTDIPKLIITTLGYEWLVMSSWKIRATE
jgi:hypothetical protein